MNENRMKAADIVVEKGINRPATAVSRGAGQCCPYLNRVRYYKTQSLKDEEIFFELNGGHSDLKRKLKNEIKENSGTSVMYYL